MAAIDKNSSDSQTVVVKKEKWNSYIGSVRFFKHLILGTVAMLVIVPWFFVLGNYLKLRQARHAAENWHHETVVLTAEYQNLLAEKTKIENTKSPLYSASFAPEYQQLYPDFYAPQPLGLTEYKENTIYLTFDDGPSPRTPEVLAILAEKDVKATFFVVGQSDEQSYQWMRDIVAQGHTIGMHSYSHQYKKIYESVESYLDDMYLMFSQIKEQTGVTPTVFRFPGGSINAHNTAVNQEIIAEMLRRGFVPYDWNVSSEDAAATPPAAATIVQSVTAQAGKVPRSVVLMHDSDYKYSTVQALPQLIDNLREQGYEFENIQPQTQPVVFSYQN